MSWIRDSGDDLVNLDRVSKLEVLLLDESDFENGVETFGVIATVGNGQVVIFSGTELECRGKIDAIAAKLSMVRV